LIPITRRIFLIVTKARTFECHLMVVGVRLTKTWSWPTSM
jgi:hypothetical protein